MEMPTYTTIDDLRQQCEVVIEQNEALKLQNEQLTLIVARLEEQLRLALHRRFGASSEVTHPDQQRLIFNEAELSALVSVPEPEFESETITYKRRKRKGHREAQLKDLPVETIHYELPKEERICPCCGDEMHDMSTQIRTEIKIIPAQVKKTEHVTHIYACRNCERTADETPIISAPVPAPVIPKSIASPSAVAYIMNQKFVDGLPLYRQEQQLARLDFELSRQTMANWMIYTADHWLSPLYARMKHHLVKLEILMADETELQVLKEPGRAAQTKSYMWLYRSGRYGPPIVLYEYQSTRAGEHPRRFLTGFSGYLQVDGYVGYEKMPGVILSGCWAHARRKFDEVVKSLPKNAEISNTLAKEGLDYCRHLYAIEKQIRDASPEERLAARQAVSKPVTENFKEWLDTQVARVLPKTTLGKAINYCINQWDKLTTFLEDGRLEIDNNRAERSIKPFVIGRKAWLFADTQAGARASAIIYSTVESAKENGLKPYNYLTHLFEKLPNMDIADHTALDALLPWSTSLPEECRLKNPPSKS
jgi:transposase